MTIHEKLERLLEYSNKSAVAEAAGITKGALHLLLKEKRTPDLKTVMGLAETLNVSAEWLITDEMDWPPVRKWDYVELDNRKAAARRKLIERLERATGRVA